MPSPTESVYIVAATRTPIGKYCGNLSSLSAVQLGSIAVESAFKQCGLPTSSVDEVFFGNVIQANVGQAPARQVALACGVPASVPCTTVNKVCSSGMKTLDFAINSIRQRKNAVVLCGGMESMSNIPYYVARQPMRKGMGHKSLVDGMLYDGLWDVYSDQHMGNCGDKCADQYNISRAQQDAFAIKSFERAQQAFADGVMQQEITPVTIRSRGKETVVDRDEGCFAFNADKLQKLRPAFNRKAGTVTAGNASQLSDGAACIIVCDQRTVQKYGLTPLVEICGYGDAAQAPVEFTTAPAIAIPKALKDAGLEMKDVLSGRDYFEINEAFGVVALVNAKLLGISMDRLNIYGGAVALGHPLGCSGARIIVTLINALKQNQGRYGVAGICNGGGGASAIVIKNCQTFKSKL